MQFLKPSKETRKYLVTDLVELFHQIDINGDANNVDLPVKKETINSSAIQISNFRQFVDFFYMKREALLHTQLYNSVKLISFKEGEVILNTSGLRDPHFNRNVAKLISKWTGRIWQVKSSTSNLGKSLHDEDIIIQQKEIELMKNNSQVKKILDEFPDSKIHSISELTDIDKNEEISNSKMTKEK